MNVAVIGTGKVGTTIGRAVARAGHAVQFGSRSPSGDIAAGHGAAMKVTTIPDALAPADLVVVAVPGNAVEEFARQHGAALAGKIVVDATNRSGGAGPTHSASTFAEHAPQARYARAFNTLGWENFADPDFGGTTADLFFSCPTADRPTVEDLVSAVGLRPMYLGEEQYDTLDGVVRLWFALAVGQGRGRHLAFKVLHD